MRRPLITTELAMTQSQSEEPLAELLALTHLLPKPTAFVFGGGGSWGALHWGILRALAETDIRPDLVVGTSVGALNGAIAAADPENSAAILGLLWPSVTREQIFPGGVLSALNTLRTSHGWLYDSANLAQYLASRLPVSSIEELEIPYVAIATDFEDGTRVEIDSGDLKSALLASSAIPGIFPWIDRDGRRLVDGGLVSNVSTDVARQRGAQSIVVLDCGLFGVSQRLSDSIIDILAQTVAIQSRQQVIHDLAGCLDVPVLWLSGPELTSTSQLDFSHTITLADAAYSTSRELLHSLVGSDILAAGLYGGPALVRDDPRVSDRARVAALPR
jgi:NTE family protein